MVEVNGLEPLTLCRLADDEPGSLRQKETTHQSEWFFWWKLTGSNR